MLPQLCTSVVVLALAMMGIHSCDHGRPVIDEMSCIISSCWHTMWSEFTSTIQTSIALSSANLSVSSKDATTGLPSSPGNSSAHLRQVLELPPQHRLEALGRADVVRQIFAASQDERGRVCAAVTIHVCAEAAEVPAQHGPHVEVDVAASHRLDRNVGPCSSEAEQNPISVIAHRLVRHEHSTGKAVAVLVDQSCVQRQAALMLMQTPSRTRRLDAVDSGQVADDAVRLRGPLPADSEARHLQTRWRRSMSAQASEVDPGCGTHSTPERTKS